MKKIITILVLLSTCFCYPQFAGGDGSEESPFLISEATHLNNVRNYLGESNSSKYFKQTANISLAAYTNWIPIGSLGSPVYYSSFYGTYDGDGYQINNLIINRTSDIGLFGVIKGAVIKNVNIVNCDVRGSSQRIGALVGFNKEGYIENCSSSGTLIGSNNSTGGLIGYIEDGTAANCQSSANITGVYYTGGLIGSIKRSNVANSYASGSISGSNQHTGGLIGGSDYSEVSYCYATGNVSSTRANVGGLIGDIFGNAANPSKVSKCYSTGTVTNNGDVSLSLYAGGLVGGIIDGIINDSYYSSNVISNGTYVGGLVGRNHSQFYPSTITRCFSIGSVTGNSIVGGFVGSNTAVSSPVSQINYSFWNVDTDDITGTSSGDNNFGATGKTTNEMTTQALSSPNIYLSTGWDFKGESSNGTDEIWNIGNGRNNGYPYLDWQYPNDPASTSAIHATQSLPLGDPDPDPIIFTGTGVTIDFSGVSGATGADDITISKYNEAPANTTGAIGSEVNIAGTSYLFTNNSGFAFTSTVQFLVSDIPGVNTALLSALNNGDATDIKFWKRPEYGSGEFTNLGFLLYNKGADNINGTADDYLYLEGVTSFSEFTFSSGSHPLPVELTSFTAASASSATGNVIVTLNWQTATEIDNYGFEIERVLSNSEANLRGLDMINDDANLEGYTSVGFVAGHGNSNSTKEYSFTDDLSNILSLNLTHSLSLILSYRLKQIDTDGNFSYSNEIQVEIDNIPGKFALEQNYPNPFNPATVISYQLSAFSKVTLKVYDILGNEVTTLVNEEKPAGKYEAIFNGDELSSGVYFYQLTVGSYFSSVKKLLLMK